MTTPTTANQPEPAIKWAQSLLHHAAFPDPVSQHCAIPAREVEAAARYLASVELEILDARATIARLEGERTAESIVAAAGPWTAGAPPHPWDQEWFLAQMTDGTFAVLYPLPEEYAYDYKTADDTYWMRDRISRWAQLSTTEYIEQHVDTRELSRQLTEVRTRADAAERDAKRYRHLRRNVCMIERRVWADQRETFPFFEMLNLPRPSRMSEDAAAEFDRALDLDIEHEARATLAAASGDTADGATCDYWKPIKTGSIALPCSCGKGCGDTATTEG